MDLTLRVTQVMHRALRPLYGDDLLWGWLARRIKLGCVSLEPVDITFFNTAEHRVLAREMRRSIFTLAAEPDWPGTTQRDFQKAVEALDAWFETPGVKA